MMTRTALIHASLLVGTATFVAAGCCPDCAPGTTGDCHRSLGQTTVCRPYTNSSVCPEGFDDCCSRTALGFGVCQTDMNNLLARAKSDSAGRRPDGRCYSHVSNYIDAVGYGGIAKGGFDAAIPSAYWAEAHMFADYLNKDGNAARLNLKNTGGNNPYTAPAGSIVVVRAGTPGTVNPTAGDIAVKASGDMFYNGGEMGYGGSGNFPAGNNYVLGIYEPTKCSGAGPSPGPAPGPSGGCKACVSNGGGKACISQCSSCGSACTSCINGGGGKACAQRCC